MATGNGRTRKRLVDVLVATAVVVVVVLATVTVILASQGATIEPPPLHTYRVETPGRTSEVLGYGASCSRGCCWINGSRTNDRIPGWNGCGQIEIVRIR